jgi:intracellular multiplication protein IcmG
MAEESKDYQEEEYVFSDAEAESNDSSATFDSSDSNDLSSDMDDTKSKNSVGESMLTTWRRNLMIGIGLLVGIFFVYKLVSFFFQSSDDNQIAKIPATIKSGRASLKTNATTALPTQEKKITLPQTTVRNDSGPQANNELMKLNKTSQSMRVEINNLQNVTQRLEFSVDNIQTQLTQLNTTLAVISDKIQAQENKLAEEAKEAQEAKKITVAKNLLSKPKPVVKKPVYYVMAIVPGRAWLKTEKGATITVGSGTVIQGYGKVVSIDPQLGRVITSSGGVIKYAPSDL